MTAALPPQLAVVMLTGRGAVADRVEGHESGAVLYLVKPTDAAELVAGFRAVLRRKAALPRTVPLSWRLDPLQNLLHAPIGSVHAAGPMLRDRAGGLGRRGRHQRREHRRHRHGHDLERPVSSCRALVAPGSSGAGRGTGRRRQRSDRGKFLRHPHQRQPGQSRIATLLPLARLVLLSAIGTLIVMMVLSELGVQVAPLLAGASICGIGGTVEKVSIRSFQLRHQNGPLHSVQFGNLGQIANFSRDWALTKMPFKLAPGTDPEKVRKIVKRVGQELMDDPAVAPPSDVANLAPAAAAVQLAALQWP